MPKPYPPQKVGSDIDRIRAQTWNQLIECLVYAMSHPRGDGVTVLNTAADLLTAAGVGGSAPAAAGGSIRMVAVTVNPAGGFGAAGGKDVIANSDGSYSISSGGAVVGFTSLYI